MDDRDIVDRLRDVRCDREPFTPEHEQCICRLTNDTADEVERLRERRDALRNAGAALVDEIRRSGTHECWKQLARALEG